MKREIIEDWTAQDEAFFGSLIEADEEFAHRLQKEYLDESEETKKEETIPLDSKNDQKPCHPVSQSTENHIYKQYEDDEALARAIYEEEIRCLHSTTASNYDYPGNRAHLNTAPRDKMSSLSIIPRCFICNKIVLLPFLALGNVYHAKCFKCMGCHDVIHPNEPFTVVLGDDGRQYPMHRNCHSELYGYKCSVCLKTITSESDGKIRFVKHPFFDNEIMCAHHSTNQVRQCSGCSRFEPLGRNFTDLHDAKRCLCNACIRTCILNSADAIPLWDLVLKFFEENLGLPIWSGMKSIPILIVGHDVLNEQQRNEHNFHGGTEQLMTRGICLSEHQRGFNFRLPSLRFHSKLASFLPTDATSSGHTYFRIPSAMESNPNSSVTAIMCLCGLPADLTASILAHEATHAWIKLHPDFDATRPIPPQVEEGTCQLVAMLFLNDGLDEASSESIEGPSDEKLRQYFRYSIESDNNEVYGEGYRKAAVAYAKIGIEALLNHVVCYGDWPHL